MYRQSTPSCSAMRAVKPSYTPGHAMNFSGSASIALNFSTAVIVLMPLVIDPMFEGVLIWSWLVKNLNSALEMVRVSLAQHNNLTSGQQIERNCILTLRNYWAETYSLRLRSMPLWVFTRVKVPLGAALRVHERARGFLSLVRGPPRTA